MSLQLKVGVRLVSATDPCEVVVVRAPSDPIDLRCGGHPFVPADSAVQPKEMRSGFDTGTQIGKRYASEEFDLEVLCTKAGSASISVGDTLLQVRTAKALPASD